MFSKYVNMNVLWIFSFQKQKLFEDLLIEKELLSRASLMKYVWERATKETFNNINAREMEEKAFLATSLCQMGRSHKSL